MIASKIAVAAVIALGGCHGTSHKVSDIACDTFETSHMECVHGTTGKIAREWKPVTVELADSLAEGDAPDATTRQWELCVYRGHIGGHIVVRCPGGYIERN